MNMNQLLKIGAKAFMNSPRSGNAGSTLDLSNLMGALTGLSGGQGKLDIKSLMSGMHKQGLDDVLQSWLGDGQNQAISGTQVSNLFGKEKVSAFASQLGLSEEEAIGGLEDAMPQIVDKASQGGSLLDSIGGVGGAMGLVNKLFGK